jgi:hypothetical protein
MKGRQFPEKHGRIAVGNCFVIKRNLSRNSTLLKDSRCHCVAGSALTRGYAMNSRERAQLRTRLRQVNIAYSALVRNRSAEGRFVQLTALRFERRVIISLLFGGELAEGRMAIARQEKAPVATLFAAE